MLISAVMVDDQRSQTGGIGRDGKLFRVKPLIYCSTAEPQGPDVQAPLGSIHVLVEPHPAAYTPQVHTTKTQIR